LFIFAIDKLKLNPKNRNAYDIVTTYGHKEEAFAFCSCFSKIGKIEEKQQDESKWFTPAGVGFYSFKLQGCLPIPGRT